ncbi:UDP-N-acetylmuramyl-tripeptide synthetase [Candidatus Parcubacteria bacterium]|nr:UDP-N-acetylmuramyl-tripeptide synthetase [Candidatus Parcubacteria bacterium]
MISKIKKLIPRPLFSLYHYMMAQCGALIYGFPSKKINVVGITGTKGKTTTTELVAAFLECAGHKTALAGTFRFKIGDDSRANLYKMTMPGRFFIQKFLRDAVNAGCDYAVVEMTSEGAKQFRHKFIDLDSLIFTNISPEHIESHGSFEKYLAAKLKIAKALEHSSKKRKIIVANADDKKAEHFLNLNGVEKHTFKLADAKNISSTNGKTIFEFHGERVETSLIGTFNVYNILAAATFALTQDVTARDISSILKTFSGVKGRMEKVTVGPEQTFDVIVDYAHTTDSLEKVYQALQPSRLIGVLGGTGGGRDTWKRKVMGEIADRYCQSIILTDEDPYDENPDKIVSEVREGITTHTPEIIMDRRLAIRRALEIARLGDTVVITGKGTDPFIMGKNGTKILWSDSNIAREELERLLRTKKTV